VGVALGRCGPGGRRRAAGLVRRGGAAPAEGRRGRCGGRRPCSTCMNSTPESRSYVGGLPVAAPRLKITISAPRQGPNPASRTERLAAPAWIRHGDHAPCRVHAFEADSSLDLHRFDWPGLSWGPRPELLLTNPCRRCRSTRRSAGQPLDPCITCRSRGWWRHPQALQAVVTDAAYARTWMERWSSSMVSRNCRSRVFSSTVSVESSSCARATTCGSAQGEGNR